MSAPLSGWRLPLRLALRDLKRYKGRSALAALLIFLPVVVMAAGLTAIATVDISPDEDAAMRSRGVSAVVTVNDEQASGARAITAFPASGRKVTQAEPPHCNRDLAPGRRACHRPQRGVRRLLAGTERVRFHGHERLGGAHRPHQPHPAPAVQDQGGAGSPAAG